MTFVMKRLHKRTTVNPRNKPCDLYLVEYEDFPEEDHWIWEPFYEISMCMIRMFFNSCLCPNHEVVLETDSSANVPNMARKSK